LGQSLQAITDKQTTTKNKRKKANYNYEYKITKTCKRNNNKLK